MSLKTYDICIVGGCGHVGLPLGIAFADKGKNVALYDINQANIDTVNKGIVPFMEEGAEPILKRVLSKNKLVATNDKKIISKSKVIIMVIGTPVDQYLNPKVLDIINAVDEIKDQLNDKQLLVMRSTLFPGITEKVYEYLQSNNRKTKVAFCPERIVEGKALTELEDLPQIISGCTPAAAEEAAKLFKALTKKTIMISPTEAELAKLFTNTWRYINFAISNQFYMIANSHGYDFYNIFDAMTEDYPRLKSFAKAGLAAGPCLFKDTMQLSSFSGNDFFLGHSAMLVNEGLPDFIVESMKKRFDLRHMVVGILGMAFKANNDDPRESLSYKLKKKMAFESKDVLCHDPYVKDDRLVSLDKIKNKADIIVVATPHDAYAKEDWGDTPIIDMWNFYGKGALI